VGVLSTEELIEVDTSHQRDRPLDLAELQHSRGGKRDPGFSLVGKGSPSIINKRLIEILNSLPSP